MIKEITIRNYKSIHDLTLELGHVNVFIGENGCGKTNILEAVAMYGAARNDALSSEALTSRGIRVTLPQLTLNSFIGRKSFPGVEFKVIDSESGQDDIVLSPENEKDIYSIWKPGIVGSGGVAVKVLSRLHEIRSQLASITSVVESMELAKNEPHIRSQSQLDDRDSVKKLLASISHEVADIKESANYFAKFLIFNLETQALRGINSASKIQPLGIYGEGLDVLLGDFSKTEWEEIRSFKYLVSWLEDIFIDEEDKLKFKGHKLGRSNSILYFRDKFMRKNNNVFAAENSNEGVLHILFYLALFISKKTPKFFAIDNIETALNPKLCRTLMKELAALAVKHDKQVLITTHNPAVLDGINLHDDTQRLFVISRDDETGHTNAKRIRMKPEVEGRELKLSEMWMRGTLGGIPTNF